MRVDILKETLVIVFTGLALNYPISVLVTWLMIDVFSITNAVAIATTCTAVLTVVATIRVYYIRLHHDKKRE